MLRCSTNDEWVKNMVTQTHKMKFYSAIRKNETMWFEGKWMQLGDIILSAVSQTQKDEGLMFFLICGR
jgi:hypothetical protein